VLHTNRVMTRFTTTYDVLHVFLYTIHGLYRVSCIALMFHVLLSCFMYCSHVSCIALMFHALQYMKHVICSNTWNPSSYATVY